MDIEKFKKRLQRLNKQKEALEANHIGNEINLTYHAGFNLGHLKGKISQIEDILDELEASKITP